MRPAFLALAAMIAGAAIVGSNRGDQPDRQASAIPDLLESKQENMATGSVDIAAGPPADLQLRSSIDDDDSGSPSAGAAPTPGELVAPASRDVTPSGITKGPQVTGPLIRVAPAKSDPPPQMPEPAPQQVKLFQTRVGPDGKITAGETVFQLTGIFLAEPDAVCGTDAAQWPCGRVAIAQLKRFIRGRAIDCNVADDAGNPVKHMRCTIGGTDLSDWMVRSGWARASTGNLEPQENEARDAARGMWSPVRP